MKKFLFYFLVCIPIIAYCQPSKKKEQKRGYVQVGPVGYLKNSSTLIGACLGSGSLKGLAGLGFGIELLSQKDNGIFVPAYADARFYFKKPTVSSPFILFQPGYVIRNKATTANDMQIKNAGGIYLSGGVGFISKTSKLGMTFQLKYSMISTKTIISQTYPVKKQSATINYPGFFGLFFGISF